MYRQAEAHSTYSFAEGSGYSLPEFEFQAPKELLTGEIVRHPILILGGGLSGLTLAASLASLKMPCVLLDEDNTVGVKGASSRGICYAQKSLEIFSRLGIYERIRELGVQWSVGRTFAGSEEVYSFDLRSQTTHQLSEQPPFINLQQFYVEAFLAERASAFSACELRWQNRVLSLTQHDGYAQLEVETPEGCYTTQARYVVDASGAHSPLRQWLSMQVQSTRGDDRWCIADVRFKDAPQMERHTWIEAPFNENRAVWQHLMADGVWRLDYQMPPDCDMAYVSREDVVRERLEQQFGPAVDCEVVWVGPYAYRSETLTSYREGSVFFVGDAAHVMSPFGARGGNSGIQDADNLAWKLAAVLRGQAAPGLLDSYDAERREAAEQNLQVTNRTARYLRSASYGERLMRDASIALAKRHGFARALVNTGRMSTASTYSRSSALGEGGGVSVQNASFQVSGKRANLVELMAWAQGRLLLLVFGPLGRAQCLELQRITQTAAVAAVHVTQAGEVSLAREQVADLEGRLHAALGFKDSAAGGVGFAIVRPDAYLACRRSFSNSAERNTAVLHELARALALEF